MVRDCIRRGELAPQPLNEETLRDAPPGTGTARLHAARIAFLVRTGWQDPISIDVGVPWMAGYQARWIVQDGNHRLFAAILLGHETIDAFIGGCLDMAARMLDAPQLLIEEQDRQ